MKAHRGGIQCLRHYQDNIKLVKMPSYRVPIEDEVFRSMKVDNFSKTPYSDATQVCDIFSDIIVHWMIITTYTLQQFIHNSYNIVTKYGFVNLSSQIYETLCSEHPCYIFDLPVELSTVRRLLHWCFILQEDVFRENWITWNSWRV